MLNDKQQSAGKRLWFAWAASLVVSATLVVLGMASPSRIVLVPVSVVGMLVMAWLIVSRFMHLREEKPGLMIAIIMCTLGLSATLFFTLVPDGLRILHLLPH